MSRRLLGRVCILHTSQSIISGYILMRAASYENLLVLLHLHIEHDTFFGALCHVHGAYQLTPTR